MRSSEARLKLQLRFQNALVRRDSRGSSGVFRRFWHQIRENTENLAKIASVRGGSGNRDRVNRVRRCAKFRTGSKTNRVLYSRHIAVYSSITARLELIASSLFSGGSLVSAPLRVEGPFTVSTRGAPFFAGEI